MTTSAVTPAAVKVATAFSVAQAIGGLKNATVLVSGIKREIRIAKMQVRRCMDALTNETDSAALSVLMRFESELEYYNALLDKLETSAPHTDAAADAAMRILATAQIQQGDA